jgi:hypothetical protein
MKYLDISHDQKKIYSLGENEKVVFFLLNRSGEITFKLGAPGAEAHIYALYTGKNDDRHTLNIAQHHHAPHTKSSALVKSVLDDSSSFSYRGTIRIEKKATGTVATQENRNLLLSSTASVETNPILEILNQEVICHHAATTSAPGRADLRPGESWHTKGGCHPPHHRGISEGHSHSSSILTYAITFPSLQKKSRARLSRFRRDSAEAAGRHRCYDGLPLDIFLQYRTRSLPSRRTSDARFRNREGKSGKIHQCDSS